MAPAELPGTATLAASAWLATGSLDTAAAAGALLETTAEDVRPVTFPPDEVTELRRAECAVAFLAGAESLVAAAVEPLSELSADALPAPEPVPVSA